MSWKIVNPQSIKPPKDWVQKVFFKKFFNDIFIYIFVIFVCSGRFPQDLLPSVHGQCWCITFRQISFENRFSLIMKFTFHSRKILRIPEVWLSEWGIFAMIWILTEMNLCNMSGRLSVVRSFTLWWRIRLSSKKLHTLVKNGHNLRCFLPIQRLLRAY